MRRSAGFVLGTAYALSTAVCLAQSPDAAPPQTPATLTSRSTLVLVPALVRNSKGELVYGLRPDDFTLTDDGVPQKLHLEEDTGGEPLALAVVIEAGAAMRSSGWHPKTHGENPDRLRSLPTMVEAIAGGVKHQIAVVGFDSRPELELELTADPVDMADTIQQLDRGNTGDHGAAILDSLVFAVDLLRHAPAGYRRAILLVSETNDRGSKHTLDEALRAIGDSNTAIYSVAFSSGKTAASEYGNQQLPTKHSSRPPPDAMHQLLGAGIPSTGNPDSIAAQIVESLLFGVFLENPNPNPPHGCMGKDPTRDPALPAESVGSRLYNCLGQLAPPLAITRMAEIAATDGLRRNVPEAVAQLTGGEYLPFTDARSLESDLAAFANHVPNRYVLSFQPQSPHPGLHVVHLELKNARDRSINARTGYWADSTSEPAPGTLKP